MVSGFADPPQAESSRIEELDDGAGCGGARLHRIEDAPLRIAEAPFL
jgi:hypothetical protein